MKRILLLIVLIAVLLSACGQEKKTHTYADLSDDQKATIDFIMSKANKWETEKSDQVKLTTYQGDLVLSVFDLDSNYGSEFSGWWTYYSYDLVADEFNSVYHRDYLWCRLRSCLFACNELHKRGVQCILRLG